MYLIHRGRVTHIYIGKLTIIGSDNGFSPGRRQAIIWTNARILLIRPLGTNREILVGIQTFSIKNIHFKMPFAKWRPFVSASMYLNWKRWLNLSPDPCVDDFERSHNKHAHGGKARPDKTTLDECKTACLDNDACTALDWE